MIIIDKIVVEKNTHTRSIDFLKGALNINHTGLFRRQGQTLYVSKKREEEKTDSEHYALIMHTIMRF